jgi:hypothetical protein
MDKVARQNLSDCSACVLNIHSKLSVLEYLWSFHRFIHSKLSSKHEIGRLQNHLLTHKSIQKKLSIDQEHTQKFIAPSLPLPLPLLLRSWFLINFTFLAEFDFNFENYFAELIFNSNNWNKPPQIKSPIKSPGNFHDRDESRRQTDLRLPEAARRNCPTHWSTCSLEPPYLFRDFSDGHRSEIPILFSIVSGRPSNHRNNPNFDDREKDKRSSQQPVPGSYGAPFNRLHEKTTSWGLYPW